VALSAGGAGRIILQRSQKNAPTDIPRGRFHNPNRSLIHSPTQPENALVFRFRSLMWPALASATYADFCRVATSDGTEKYERSPQVRSGLVESDTNGAGPTQYVQQISTDFENFDKASRTLITSGHADGGPLCGESRLRCNTRNTSRCQGRNDDVHTYEMHQRCYSFVNSDGGDFRSRDRWSQWVESHTDGGRKRFRRLKTRGIYLIEFVGYVKC
jgi:hypothetical protein